MPTPAPPPASARRRALVLAALALAAALAGCVAQGQPDPELVKAVAGTRAMSWEPGNFWAYRAVFHEDVAVDVALIVHERDAQGFHLGSNASAGFFGLPFTGNVTPSLNPRIGHEVWPLYQFPLEDGKSWSYQMFGYEARTVARAALVDVPGVGPAPGFVFESSSYGRVFARYDYSPVTGWFTRLQLIEPTDDTRVLDVTLTAYGTDYGQAYYVERPIRTVRLDYPAAPGEVRVAIPDGFLRVNAILMAQTGAGVVDARLEDGHGRTLAQARAVAKETSADRASAGRTTSPWTLHHTGAGLGLVFLEVTGLSANGPLAPPPAQEAPDLSLARLLGGPGPAGAARAVDLL